MFGNTCGAAIFFDAFQWMVVHGSPTCLQAHWRTSSFSGSSWKVLKAIGFMAIARKIFHDSWDASPKKQQTSQGSHDWMMGTFTGNPYVWWQKDMVSCRSPLNQSIERRESGTSWTLTPATTSWASASLRGMGESIGAASPSGSTLQTMARCETQRKIAWGRGNMREQHFLERIKQVDICIIYRIM